MKTDAFIQQHNAPQALRHLATHLESMREVWDFLSAKHDLYHLLWIAGRPGIFSDSVLKNLAWQFVLDTPLMGLTVAHVIGGMSLKMVHHCLGDLDLLKLIESAERNRPAALGIIKEAANSFRVVENIAHSSIWAAAAAIEGNIYSASTNGAYFGGFDAVNGQLNMVIELGNPF